MGLAEMNVAKAVPPVELCMVVWWGHIPVSSNCFQLLPDLPFSLEGIIFFSRSQSFTRMREVHK